MRKFKSTSYDPGPPFAVTWDEYATRIGSDWEGLLASDPDEPAVHAFLEQHPCLLPEPYGMYRFGHNGIVGGVYYSKPELPGLRPLIPDFMYLAIDSANVTAVFVEIERPGKAHATKEDEPTADLRHARAQVDDWRVWFSISENVTLFLREYGVRPGDLRDRRFQQRYVLVFGRRAELALHPRFARTRGLPRETVEMTYDRLSPSPRYAGVPVVRLDRSAPGDTRFRMISTSPFADTLAFGEIDRETVLGIDDALEAQPGLSPARRAFLRKKKPRKRKR